MCSRPIHFKEGIQTVFRSNELKCPLLYFKNITKFIFVNFVKKPFTEINTWTFDLI